MTKILYFDWHSAGTEFYRLMPLDYIDESSLKITRSSENNLNFALINAYDVLIIERPSSPISLNLIKLAKDMGKYVITDWDDDPLHIDEYNPLYWDYQQQKHTVIESLVLSDEVWVSTNAIKNSFMFYNGNMHIIPNAHNDILFPVSQKKPFTYNKIATWRGGQSHDGDMYDTGVPEHVIDMVNSNPEWKFEFYGQHFAYILKRVGANYSENGVASTIQFHKLMHKQNASVFFYPLANTLFNKSKSNCSWLESTYSGSAFFGNISLPEFNKAGMGEFLQLNMRLSEAMLRDMNEVSWEYIQKNLLLSKVNELRKERLLKI